MILAFGMCFGGEHGIETGFIDTDKVGPITKKLLDDRKNKDVFIADYDQFGIDVFDTGAVTHEGPHYVENMITIYVG